MDEEALNYAITAAPDFSAMDKAMESLGNVFDAVGVDAGNALGKGINVGVGMAAADIKPILKNAVTVSVPPVAVDSGYQAASLAQPPSPALAGESAKQPTPEGAGSLMSALFQSAKLGIQELIKPVALEQPKQPEVVAPVQPASQGITVGMHGMSEAAAASSTPPTTPQPPTIPTPPTATGSPGRPSTASSIGGAAVGGAVAPKGASGLGGMVGASMGFGKSLIGASVGGLVGSLKLGLEAVPKALGSMVAAPAKLAASSLGLLGNSLRALEGPLGPIGMGLDLLTTGLETISGVIKGIPLVGSILGPLSDVLAGIPGIFKDITTTLVGFAATASPGMFKRYQVALQDVQGVIGQAFLPFLELMTDGIRLFGDVLANVLPNMSEVRAALSSTFGEFANFGQEMRKTMAEIGPTIRGVIIKGLQQLSHWLGVVGRAAMLLAKQFGLTFKSMKPDAAAAGLAGGPRTSAGASAQPVRIEGIDEYTKALQTAAFAAPGTGEKVSPEVEAIQNLGDIEQQALAVVSGINTAISAVSSGITTVVTTIGSVVEAVRDAGDTIDKIHNLLTILTGGDKDQARLGSAKFAREMDQQRQKLEKAGGVDWSRSAIPGT